LKFVSGYVVHGVRYEFPHMCPDVGHCAVARWVAARYVREYFGGESSVDDADFARRSVEEVGE